MKRSVLDGFTLEHRLDERAIAAALDLTGARPGRAAWREFGIRFAHAAGIASLAAGGIFFVAANWQRFAAFGRFAIIEAWLLVCVGLALWRPPPHLVGRGAIFTAVIATGALLALFGQTYQTGADLYEFFFGWALLALAFAIGGRWAATWAAWWIVLNTGLAIFCGWIGPNHFMWGWLDRWGVDKAAALMLPFAVNLAGAGIFSLLRRTRLRDHSSRWLARMLMSIAFLYGTIASIVAILGREWYGGGATTRLDVATVLVFAGVSIALAVDTLFKKRDVFPMALIIGCWIAVTTTTLVRALEFRDIGAFFLVAMWLVGTSSAAAFVLMRWLRAWRIDEDAQELSA